MRIFNTEGPINSEDHYFIPNRLNEKVLNNLFKLKKYFILHAPRQSGKTTGIQHFVRELNAEGKYKALYVNVEPAQAARGNVEAGMKTILNEFRQAVYNYLPEDDSCVVIITEELKNVSGSSLSNLLSNWARASDKPIVLFIDEIDALVGDTLISVLRQLRAGYTNRPKAFPQAVCLVGVRDVRDYRIWSDKEGASILGGSAFNIKSESLLLPNFSPAQLQDLYLQHTQETGQKFTQEAIDYAFELSQGQPWLANMLAYQACFCDPLMIIDIGEIDPSKTVTKEVIERAKETIIRRQDTHIDVLIERLSEPRVAQIVDAILRGTKLPSNIPKDDVQYVIDLGLITRRDKFLCIANPIYHEIVPRELSCMMEEAVFQKTIWYQNSDGSIDIKRLIEKFQQFYRENADIWIKAQKNYPESAPHLIFMAFLQRIINGCGSIHREYALGRKSVDLFIKWPSDTAQSDELANLEQQLIVVELKVFKDKNTLEEGLIQTASYMEICGATEGHLVIFDPRETKSWDEKIYHEEQDGITIWGV